MQVLPYGLSADMSGLQSLMKCWLSPSSGDLWPLMISMKQPMSLTEKPAEGDPHCVITLWVQAADDPIQLLSLYKPKCI